jgi:N-acetylglucosamine malate deacetylase 2
MKRLANPAGTFWRQLADPESGLRSKAQTNLRVLVLSAHQDDETIGASLALARSPDSTVVFLTDGAPHDTRLWSAGPIGSRADYARIRREEAASALALVNLAPERIFSLGAVDQESCEHIETLVEKFIQTIRELRPHIVITHPYEGGHPDHDTAALIASLAIEALRRNSEAVPELIEMTSYYLQDGCLITGSFLPGSEADEPPQLLLELSEEERVRKTEMLKRYCSQRTVLRDFPIRPERLRPAPRYDFRQPPHAGKLWYECLGWPLTGERWRALAASALTQVSRTACL